MDTPEIGLETFQKHVEALIRAAECELILLGPPDTPLKRQRAVDTLNPIKDGKAEPFAKRRKTS